MFTPGWPWLWEELQSGLLGLTEPLQMWQVGCVIIHSFKKKKIKRIKQVLWLKVYSPMQAQMVSEASRVPYPLTW